MLLRNVTGMVKAWAEWLRLERGVEHVEYEDEEAVMGVEVQVAEECMMMIDSHNKRVDVVLVEEQRALGWLW